MEYVYNLALCISNHNNLLERNAGRTSYFEANLIDADNLIARAQILHYFEIDNYFLSPF